MSGWNRRLTDDRSHSLRLAFGCTLVVYCVVLVHPEYRLVWVTDERKTWGSCSARFSQIVEMMKRSCPMICLKRGKGFGSASGFGPKCGSESKR
jgi:hypothetical protein